MPLQLPLPCDAPALSPTRPTCTASTADYKHIMREEAMVTAGELREKYEKAEDYEDDFM